MKNKIFCAAIVYMRREDQNGYLLVQQEDGSWSIPKDSVNEEDDIEKYMESKLQDEFDLAFIFFRDRFYYAEQTIGDDYETKTDYLLFEICTLFDDLNSNPIESRESVHNMCFFSLDEVKKMNTEEGCFETLCKADDFIIEDRKDELYCKGADTIVNQLQNVLIDEGMEPEPDKKTLSNEIVVRFGDLLIRSFNGRHKIFLYVELDDIDFEAYFYEVSGFLSEIIDKYPEEDLYITIESPSLVKCVSYDDQYPEVENLKKEIDKLISIMKVYTPAIRAIASGEEVSKDDSEASKLYYEEYLRLKESYTLQCQENQIEDKSSCKDNKVVRQICEGALEKGMIERFCEDSSVTLSDNDGNMVNIRVDGCFVFATFELDNRHFGNQEIMGEYLTCVNENLLEGDLFKAWKMEDDLISVSVIELVFPFFGADQEVNDIIAMVNENLEKLRQFEPVLRAIDEEREIPRDDSLASKLYYDVFLNTEAYRDIMKQKKEE